MDRDGYMVLQGWWTAGVDGLRTSANKYLDANSGPIFNDNPDERNDRKRLQATFPLASMRALHEALKAEWPSHHVGGAVALRSLPGCHRQAAHCDYIPDAAFLGTDEETVPLLFLLALEDDTKLDVWPGSHRLVRHALRGPPIPRRTLTLAAGDAVLFRGDLVHAGSEYSKANTRIHVYLDSPVAPRDPNRTWIVYKHADPLLQARIDEST
jgi:hypothetical protein